jgi:hypothetical protein
MRLGAAAAALTLGLIGLALWSERRAVHRAQWSNQSQNGSTISLDDEHAAPTGPSTVIRGIMRRDAERRARERQERALSLERALRPDAAEGPGTR